MSSKIRTPAGAFPRISKVETPSGPETVVIIGGGASGALTALQLARQSNARPLHVILVEGQKERGIGQGKAYSTQEPGHTLNVRAKGMSILPGQDAHFLEWAHSKSLPIGPDDFAPRRLFGRYVQETLDQTLLENPNVKFTRVDSQAIGITKTGNGYQVALQNGVSLRAPQLVLAMGNHAPREPVPPSRAPQNFYQSSRYFADPYGPRAERYLEDSGPVLLVGSGLSSADAIASIFRRNPERQVYVVSPHGKFPVPHALYAPLEPAVAEAFRKEVLQQSTPIGVLHVIRLRIARNPGVDPRAWLDGIRFITQDIYAKFSPAERQFFLNNMDRRIWGRFRHRMPEEQHRLIEEMRGRGKLIVLEGRIDRVSEAGDGLRVEIRPSRKDAATQTIQVGHVVNGIGPNHDYLSLAQNGNRFIASLLSQGLAAPHPFRIGLRTNGEGQVLGVSGEVQPRLYVVGPGEIADRFEVTAIPDIKSRAEALAKKIWGTSLLRQP